MSDFIPSNDPAAEFLSSAGGDNAPAFKFENVGDGVGGIVKRVDVVTRPNLNNTGNERSLVVTLETREGVEWSVWIGESKPRLVNAVKGALQQYGLAAPQIGDKLAVKFTGTAAPKNPAHSPAKVYAASYERGVTTTAAAAPASAEPSADDLF